ncbi:hypothetical protein CDL15_Pgr020317 [Punica granatum]|uniref:Uncharacterized protein n=1 Tax=Punica granatum TaxID=22663 RepID=A0A218X4G7_PUNGR|nr:hypothetical protein CDL15_Pgr020317 [Punica granatum]
MNNKGKHGPLRKAEESSQKNRRTRNPENNGAGTVALFITESPKHRKVPNMGDILLKSRHPDPPRTPFLTELPGFAPLTSKRPLKTGLQAPRDYQGWGTSFRQPSGTRLDLPKYASVITNASR